MIATLQNSVKKMNDLLARLTRGNGGAPSPVRDTCLHPILSAIAGAKQRAHPVHLFGDPALSAKADPARLEQALAHLVQNRSEEHTSELQSLMRISYAVFCLKKKNNIAKLLLFLTP